MSLELIRYPLEDRHTKLVLPYHYQVRSINTEFMDMPVLWIECDFEKWKKRVQYFYIFDMQSLDIQDLLEVKDYLSYVGTIQEVSDFYDVTNYNYRHIYVGDF